MVAPAPGTTSLRTDGLGDLALEQAWKQDSLQRERPFVLLASIAAGVVVPLWSILDYFLAYRFFYPFLALRLAVTGTSVVILLVVHFTRSIKTLRVCGALMMATTGILIAPMLPVLDAHYYAYVIGLSTVFWGSGVIFNWPVRYSIYTYFPVLLAFFGFHIGMDSGVPTGDFIGATFYLLTAALLSCVSVGIRYRLEYRAFGTAHELERSHRELESTLTTLTETQAQLVKSEKLSALGRLLAQLSHEINNPINVIHNNLAPIAEYWSDVGRVLDAYRASEAELGDKAEPLAELRREVDLDYLREDFPAAHEAMTMAVQRIRSIHDNLRTFIRGGTSELAELDVNAEVEATLKMLHRGLPEGVQVESELGELPGLRFRTGELNQVLFNLLQNAVDVVAPEGTIRVKTRHADGQICIEICDSGPGVAEEIRDRIFEPFFTTKDVAKGTGLGLAICHQIVQSHGGALRVTNGDQGGACFVVTLPPNPDMVNQTGFRKARAERCHLRRLEQFTGSRGT